MSEVVKELTIHIDCGKDATEEQVDSITTSLLHDIKALDVEFARKLRTEQQSLGAKSGDAVTLGVILIAVMPLYGKALIEFLAEWILRPKNNEITIEIKRGENQIKFSYDLNKTPSDTIKYLIREFSTLIED